MKLSRRAAVTGAVVLRAYAAGAVTAPLPIKSAEWWRLNDLLDQARDRMGWRHPGYCAAAGIWVEIEGTAEGRPWRRSAYTEGLAEGLPLIGSPFGGAFTSAFLACAFAARGADWRGPTRLAYASAVKLVSASL